MTASEFREWAAKGEGVWKIDPVLLHNEGEYMCSKGERSGRFIIIEADGKLLLGTYEYAYPYITDAEFHITFSKKFDSCDEALARVRKFCSAFPSVDEVERLKKSLEKVQN